MIEIGLVVYDQQFKSVSDKIDSLSKKAELKKVPKLKKYKESIPLAYYNGVLNQLGVSEKLLEQWQKGKYAEEDIDAILAHEFGHAIGHQRKSHHNLQLNIHLLLLIAISVIFAIGMSSELLIIRDLILFASNISFVFLIFRLPKIISKPLFSASWKQTETPLLLI